VRAWLRLDFALNIGLIAVGLGHWGARELREDVAERLQPCAVAVACLLVTDGLFEWLGLSLSVDVIEQRNAAAFVALCAARSAVAVLYVLGSAGEGESLLENYFSAALGILALFALWALLEVGAGVSRSIAVERDLASGLRFAGFLLAESLLVGRALAGNWHSESDALSDLLRLAALPAFGLLAAAFGVERLARPSRRRHAPAWPLFGMVPALAYLAFAASSLHRLGPWEGMPG
jgi:uncharacterized membrane protein YjfL (UPF0719 family)